VKQLCEKAIEIFVEEANVQRVDAPVTICEPQPPSAMASPRLRSLLGLARFLRCPRGHAT
jgi:hypothetical protein